MMETFRHRINSMQCTKFILAVQISRRVFLGLSASTTAHKESVFSFKLFKRTSFLHFRTDRDGGKQFLKRTQKILWGREVIERKPQLSF